jgi:Flp pilus assembly protein TadD
MSLKRRLLPALVLVAAALGTVALWQRKNPAVSNSELMIAGADAGYINSSACAGCHREIWDSFQRTGMGRSMKPAAAAVMPAGFAERRTFSHAASDRHYTLLQRNGRFYQRRHQTGPDGRETAVFEQSIDFVVGSGNHAKSFLHRTTDGRLLELPLAWYAEGGGVWGMNPGYDHRNQPDFQREVLHECIFCHTAYPQIRPGDDQFGSEPVFPGRIPEGIDCQRCHGPGRDHVQAANTGNREKIRRAIVNPARLPAARQLEVCMQCHLETTSARLPHAILRWQRGAFSFRPGEPLEAYSVQFDHAPGMGRDDKFEIASQAYRFRKSACFQKSGGKLTCTTCHDPHRPVEAQAAQRACRRCHETALSQRGGHPRDPDCTGCHMPKRRTEDVVHVVMTDHYIRRRKPPGDLLAARQERPDTEEAAYVGPVALYYPPQLPPGPESELYLAVAQVKQFSNLREGVPRLAKLVEATRPPEAAVYLELAEAYEQLGQSAEAIRYFEEALRRGPDLRPARLGLARALSKTGQHERAARVLRERPLADAKLWNSLGLAELQRGNTAEATAAFRHAIELQPDDAEAHNNLGGVLGQTGDRAGALVAYREAIRLQPGFAGAHRNLAKLAGSFGEAEYHFRKALYYRPAYAQAHYDYGVALAGEERFADAAVQFEAAVSSDPALAEAHASLGDMLAVQGRVAEAIPHYQRALQLRPDLESARTGLQMARSRRR